MKRRLAGALLLWALMLAPQAHIGLENVFFEGSAGPYQLRVAIQPPPVVPGRAQIHVRIHNGPVTRVSVLPVRWDAGRKGAPPPDPALPVPGEPGLHTAELWIMDFGAYSVFVDVEGPLGQGSAIVPFNSVSSRRLEMPRWMGLAFLAAGALLFLFLVSVVGAALRESVLAPGAAPDAARRRRARLGMAVACAVLAAVLWKGNTWWKAVDGHFQARRLYKTIEIPARVEQRGDHRYLTLEIVRNENWRDHTPLVADHGKLMHLFLVAEPDMSAFAHLHPEKISETVFETRLPPLPEGDYTVYADINHESGFTQTLLARISLPAAPSAPALPGTDDSVWAEAGGAAPGNDTRRAVDLPGGGTLHALSPLSWKAGQEAILRFQTLAADGGPLPLEPYLGMWSHAVIRSRDGSVFTHLHPSGTISMASQELFARRERGEDLRRPIDVLCGRPERDLVFPFSFPKPGPYRIWVQVKSAGQVQTAACDLEAF